MSEPEIEKKKMSWEQKSLAWFEREYPEQTLAFLVSKIQKLIDEGHSVAWGNVGPQFFIAVKRELSL